MQINNGETPKYKLFRCRNFSGTKGETALDRITEEMTPGYLFANCIIKNRINKIQKGDLTVKHKDYYDDVYIDILSDKLIKAHTQFNNTLFKKELKGQLDALTLFQRFDLIVVTLEKSMPNDYTYNVTQFFNLLEDELQTETGMFTQGWWYWPIGRYVEKNGTQDFNKSMAFIKELTKRFTGEYAIRPLIATYPKEAFLLLIEWSKDKNVHVRRLASEGVRIGLPWSKKLYTALDEFDSYVIILDNLKNDDSKFVQKSVANNLNDLFKENPEKACFIIEKWQKETPTKNTNWIIAHGMRRLKNKSQII